MRNFSTMVEVRSTLPREARKLLLAAKSRHGRRKRKVSLCEGVRCVQEALRRRPEWIRFAVVEADFVSGEGRQGLLESLAEVGVPLYSLAADEFATFAETAHSQGVLLLFTPEIECRVGDDRELPPFALVLDRIAEPGNMGTILRTAWAVGLSHVWLTCGCVDPYSPKAIRAGMGAQFALHIVHSPPLPDLKRQLADIGYHRMWLGKPRGGVSCASEAFVIAGAAVVVGNEADGVAEVAGADTVSIPMPGDAESLNASQAATIFLYEGLRRGCLSSIDAKIIV